MINEVNARNQAKWLFSTDFSLNLKPVPAGDTIDREDKDILNALNIHRFMVKFTPIPLEVIKIGLYAGMPPVLKNKPKSKAEKHWP